MESFLRLPSVYFPSMLLLKIAISTTKPYHSMARWGLVEVSESTVRRPALRAFPIGAPMGVETGTRRRRKRIHLEDQGRTAASICVLIQIHGRMIGMSLTRIRTR